MGAEYPPAARCSRIRARIYSLSVIPSRRQVRRAKLASSGSMVMVIRRACDKVGHLGMMLEFLLPDLFLPGFIGGDEHPDECTQIIDPETPRLLTGPLIQFWVYRDGGLDLEPLAHVQWTVV